MTSLALDSARLDPHLPYFVDGLTSAAMGLVLIAAAGPLTALAGWSPPPAFLFTLGILLLPWALLNFMTGRIARPAAGLIRGIIAVDLAWVLGSLVLLALYWSELTAWGIGLLVVQMLAVAGVFAVKLAGARTLQG